MMSRPPTATTATDSEVVKNSIVPIKMPISLWNCFLEVL